MTAALYPWQHAAWLQLQQLRERLPHAILFHGPQGIGKIAFAERFGQSLLCQSPGGDHQPCGKCDACGWFDQYSHPDYRRVRPELLDEDEATEAGEAEPAEGKKARAKPSREIKIDQVRALADFMSVSTHRQGMRVVVLYPAEALNTAAANALLKTLEEPPPATMFLLVSNSLDRLLPTILSRCRKFALAPPAQDAAEAWLSAQGIDNADAWLAEEGGAPLAALDAARQGEARETMEVLLQCLARPGIEAALKTAEKLQKAPVPDLVAWQQRWLHDMFSFKLSGRIRYYPRYRKEIAALAGRADAGALMQVVKAAQERRAVAEHPLAARLFIEDMLLEYTSLFA